MNKSPRIDQPIQHHPSYRLYQPLRKSLLKNNLSQSNISSRTNLSLSRVNPQDLSTSRVSRRMKSLSPEEVQTIKSNIFIPINKRLFPTKNLQLVKNKRYTAIDIQERVHKPIPAIRFNSLNRFNANKVQQIVYQLQQQPHYVHPNQTNIVVNHLPHSSFRKSQQITQPINIYTMRNQPHYSRHSAVLNTFAPVTVVDRSMSPHRTSLRETAYFPATNAVTSFENHFQYPRSSIRQSKLAHINTINSPNGVKLAHINTINSPNVTKQLQSTDYIPGSGTSFEQQRMSSQVSKGYDFSRLTNSTSNKNNQSQKSSNQNTSNQYSSRKKQQWKYNLYSIFDQPINTKCNKTGCLNNEIIASRPNMYEWQQ